MIKTYLTSWRKKQQLEKYLLTNKTKFCKNPKENIGGTDDQKKFGVKWQPNKYFFGKKWRKTEIKFKEDINKVMDYINNTNTTRISTTSTTTRCLKGGEEKLVTL